MKISLFIFDLDGTIIDSKRDIAASVNYTMKALGLKELPENIIYDFVGLGVTPLIQQAVEEAGGPQAFPKALDIFKTHYNEHLLDTTVPFDGVWDILEYFQKTPKVVLTNKSQGYSEKIIEGLKLNKYFKSIFGGDTSFPKKPDPTIVYHLMKEYHSSPENTLIIGDSLVDIKTGKNAGILTCGAFYGFRPREEIEKSGCDYKIEKIQEMIKLFPIDN
ncbi:MAG: HAD-IA family hydrolase [Deltaproteobacteria bacterium]|nr:MAG: HAD-IA family hydrolase [Deltaproteobacteria bacterium]